MSVRSLPLLRAMTALALLMMAATAPAQCGLDWQSGAPTAGPDGTVAAVLPLPNGDIVAGGTFRRADGNVVGNLARWDGATWSALGGGANGDVTCLTRLANGDIVAGGSFTQFGGIACNRIARWDGATWSPLGAGPGGTVQGTRVLANGALAAVGSFVLGGVSTCFAVWNGTTWSTLGGGTGSGEGRALAQLANGDLVLGGTFDGLPNTTGLRRWDGIAWTAIAGFDTNANATVDDLALRGNGDLVITGSFRMSGIAQNLAAWDGVTMQALTAPVPANLARTLLRLASGDVLLGGTVAALATTSLARWNGVTWQAINGAPTRIESLAEDGSGNLVVGTTAPPGFPRPATVYRFNGVSWQAVGAPTPPLVQVMVALPDGSAVVGGPFAQIDGVPVANIARWIAGNWLPIGLGMNGRVSALAVAPNGDVFAAGLFTQAGGVAANGIARWDGQTWWPVGAGLPPSGPAIDTPRAVAIAGNGDVLVAMDYGGVQRFDGQAWSPAPIPGSIAVAHAMVTRDNGDVVIGGSFNGFGAAPVGVLVYAAGGITPVPGAPNLVTSMLRTGNDGIVVTGNGVQQWDGANWTALPFAYIYGFAQLPSSDVVAVGPSAALGGGATSCLYRLRANGWQSWGDVVGGPGRAVIVTREGDLLLSGSFVEAGGLVASGLAHARPACPATTTPAGASCQGGAGPVVLLPDRGAWLGSTFRAIATGMTNNSLALQLLGTQTLAPPVPLPFGAAGCTLGLTPLLSDVLLPSAGEAISSLALPNQPSLVGQQFVVQVLGLEFSGTSLAQVTGSNLLLVTIGSW